MRAAANAAERDVARRTRGRRVPCAPIDLDAHAGRGTREWNRTRERETWPLALADQAADNRDALDAAGRDTRPVERLRCIGCGNVLSVPVRLVAMPSPPHWSLLDHHHVNPPMLEPGTYAVDQAEHGRDRVAGTFVLSPGDVRGTRFVHERVLTGCWSLVGWLPCMACEVCGALVASRTDDCHVPQDARFYPDMIIRETCGEDPHDAPDPFALIADWDEPPPDTRQFGWVPKPTRHRPELVAARWRGRGLKSETYRDDPPA